MSCPPNSCPPHHYVSDVADKFNLFVFCVKCGHRLSERIPEDTKEFKEGGLKYDSEKAPLHKKAEVGDIINGTKLLKLFGVVKQNRLFIVRCPACLNLYRRTTSALKQVFEWHCKKCKRLTIHGHGKTGKQSKTYVSWYNMIQRSKGHVSQENKKYYSDVTCTKRWLKFINFLTDMGERPEGKTLDRINPFKGYSKRNCRWATPSEQTKNTRSNFKKRLRKASA